MEPSGGGVLANYGLHPERIVESGIEPMASSTGPQLAGPCSILSEKVLPFLQAAASAS